MPFISSPVQYPATSSPKDMSPRKKRRLEQTDRKPLDLTSNNVERKSIAGFVLDDSDEDEGAENTGPDSLGYLLFTADKPAQLNVSTRNPVDANDSYVSKDPISALQNMDPVPMFHGKQRPSASTNAHSIPTRTCSGHVLHIPKRPKKEHLHYSQLVAARSTVAIGKAQKSYYGIDIHHLLEQASHKKNTNMPSESELPNIPIAHDSVSHQNKSHGSHKTNLWTEKYRARKFTDLVGDERTHRSVLRWLKCWDSIVFPHVSRAKPKSNQPRLESDGEELLRKKILLLTGPPGLGKTTLAHVCARQAGYEVQEINASDERSREVVRGRIRDMVATENVRPINTHQDGTIKKAARPVCVVVDEVDGVVGGSGGAGDNGFVKALADLLALDQKNSGQPGSQSGNTVSRQKRKGDKFRLLRPIILICNDVYHPSLRLLRQGSLAETIYTRKPPLNMVVPRIQSIFEREGVPCDSDGARQLCEATWGVSNRKEDKSGGGVCEGDIRSILVTGEWAAMKLRAEDSGTGQSRLTKRWVQENLIGDLSRGGSAARGLGRGGAKELVDRIFTCNAGISTTATHSRNSGTNGGTLKQRTMDQLRELIAVCAEDDRAMTDCFAMYPTLPYQDDNFLTKPFHAYEWLHFHDRLSGLVHSLQEWELAPYLSTPLLAFHELFASTSRHSYANMLSKQSGTTDGTADQDMEPAPFTGPRASYLAAEATKANRAALQHLQSQLTLPLMRVFRSPEALAFDLLPYILRMLSPNVKPVVVGGSGSDKSVASVRRGAEKDMVRRAVDAMLACGVRFERGRVDHGETTQPGSGGWIYRMEPGLDAMGVFETASKGLGFEGPAKTRFAVRQVLEQEWKREVVKREQEARVRRMTGLASDADPKMNGLVLVAFETADKTRSNTGKPDANSRDKHANKAGMKRDFFGRLVADPKPSLNSPGETIDPVDGNGQPDGGMTAKRAKTGVGGGDPADDENRVWVTFHEGFSNAVRKGITMKELLDGM